LSNEHDGSTPATAPRRYDAGVEDVVILPLVLIALAAKYLYRATLSLLIHILDYAFPILLQLARFPLFTVRIVGDGIAALLKGVVRFLPVSGTKREAWRELVSRHWSWLRQKLSYKAFEEALHHAFEAGMAWVFRKCKSLTPRAALLVLAGAVLWLPISFGAATAMHAVLFAKVRTDAQQLESSYDSTLKALMAALDAKDEVTEGHCERVAKLTTELARLMGVPEQMMVHIERGALLHDVGKIGVPDGILKKPAALNDSEWEAMRKHPLLAGLMVSKVGFLEPALPILLYHHERFDGTGYPFGLTGDNIPVEARIFSIIDAYDAMTSDRPYRPAMQHHSAMEEVRRNSGTQFDPQVVAAFEQLMSGRRDLREQTGRRVLGMHDLDHSPESDQHVA
jgi:hypothetical protein